ncbi:MAG: DUF4192 domain-containing protein [Propionibacteriaceae bacterium]|jgi:hypothetical protein|nr:DUF4192 domain-containing protein [Propionibacteriaceae bacterium]
MTSPPLERSPETLNVRRPGDLVLLLPHLLGFRPADSLVLLLLRDQEVHLTARFDLFGLSARPAAVADFVDEIRQSVAPAQLRVLAVVYAPRPQAQAAWSMVEPALADGVDLALLVDGSSWWPADAPPSAPGRPCPRHGPLKAAAVRAGLSVAPSRQALADRLAPPAPEREDELLARRLGLMAELAESSTQDWIDALRDLVARSGQGRPLSDDDCLRAGLLVEQTEVRDQLWLELDTASAPAQIRLWSGVLRRSVAGQRVLPLCVLGLVAWQAGQGALQSICHERAAALDPGFPLVGLLDTIRDRHLPPSSWRESVRVAWSSNQAAGAGAGPPADPASDLER